MRKAIIVLACVGALAGLTGAALAAGEPGAMITHPVSQSYNEHPNPAFPANDTLPSSNFMSRGQILKLVNVTPGGHVVSTQLETWAQHVAADLQNRVVSHYVAPNRMVWVVKIAYPQGIETGAGFYANATVTATYDAQTGRPLNYGVTGDYRGGGGPPPSKPR